MKLNSDQTNQLESLLTLNQEISQRMPLWNQGMGGNISVKFSDELMAIKPSGLRLDELETPQDFAYLNYQDFLSFLMRQTAAGGGLPEKEYAYSQEIDKSKLKEFTDRRASMEAGFHAALKSKYVLHIHHLNAVVFVDLLSEAQGSTFYSKWKDYFEIVPYRRPGWELSAFFIKKRVSCPLILMQNHGAILQINEPEELKRFLEFDTELEELLAKKLEPSWKSAQKIIKAKNSAKNSSAFSAPFKYFYPDVAIFENKLRKFLIAKEGANQEFVLADQSQGLPQDLLENWQAMLYLHHLRPNMPGLTVEDAESLRGMPSEMARVAQMISMAATQSTAMQGKKR